MNKRYADYCAARQNIPYTHRHAKLCAVVEVGCAVELVRRVW